MILHDLLDISCVFLSIKLIISHDQGDESFVGLYALNDGFEVLLEHVV